MEMVGALFAVAILGALYFGPSILASYRGRAVGPVLVVNLFFGWTLIGWVIALAWAMTELSAKEQAEQDRFKPRTSGAPPAPASLPVVNLPAATHTNLALTLALEIHGPKGLQRVGFVVDSVRGMPGFPQMIGGKRVGALEREHFDVTAIARYAEIGPEGAGPLANTPPFSDWLTARLAQT